MDVDEVLREAHSLYAYANEVRVALSRGVFTKVCSLTPAGRIVSVAIEAHTHEPVLVRIFDQTGKRIGETVCDSGQGVLLHPDDSMEKVRELHLHAMSANADVFSALFSITVWVDPDINAIDLLAALA